MRQFVQSIAQYARADASSNANANFLVIPQNGHSLLTDTGDADGELSTDYIAAIDGVGREDLFFGYNDDNVATPTGAKNEMIAFMDLAKGQGVVPLVTDYVHPGHANIASSYSQNGAKGYVSFAATHRELDNDPSVEETTYVGYYPNNESTGAVASLDDAANFLYVLDPSGWPDTATFLSDLAATNYDVFIIDAFDQNGIALTSGQVDGLKAKPGAGAQRLVIAYMSIGEAEDYRYYWQAGWKKGHPGFIAGENPDWPGNYKVKYWDADWQAVITGNADSYLQKLLDAGFDGVYLDIIDAFEYWE